MKTGFIQQTFSVMRKELRDSVRDRRSLMSGLFFAFFGPLLVVLMLNSLAKSMGSDKPLELAVVGAERAPNLIAYLEQRDVKVRPASGDAEEILREKEEPLVIEVDPDYGADLQNLKPAGLRVVHDSTSPASGRALRRLQVLLEGFARDTARWRLLARGVDPAISQPLRIQPLDISTVMARAGKVLGSLPLFFLLATFVGGMNVAIDTTAGERERGSLESLLCHAVPASAIASGKWLAAATFAFLSIAVNLAMTVLVFSRASFEGLGISLRFGFAEALNVFLVLAPLTLLVPAIQMLISIHAKNFKEAQTQLSLLMFLPMIPGFLLIAGALEKADWMFAVPMLGQQIAIADLLGGVTLPAASFALGAGSTLLTCVLLVYLLGRLFANEKIVLAR
jgi:sodium transport system permease protein